jgi:hypothetical protein
VRLAHHTRSDLALVVDHDGSRDDVAEAEFAQSVEVRAGSGVKTDVEPAEEWLDFASVLLIVDRHGDKLDIFARVRLRERGKSRQLILAWLAPCSPEVEHNDFSSQAGKLLRLAGKILNRKLRSRLGERAD